MRLNRLGGWTVKVHITTSGRNAPFVNVKPHPVIVATPFGKAEG
jgi:hypothetical protein